ncbi:MAG: hypothetical protein J7K04_16320 [Spirochaetales bacterium]|nr:hypothetical protein [Spirochaetales bacterium]
MHWAIDKSISTIHSHYKNSTETAEYPPQDNLSYLTGVYQASGTFEKLNGETEGTYTTSFGATGEITQLK